MKTIVVGQGAMGLLWYHHLLKSMPVSDLSLLASAQHNLNEDNYLFIDNTGLSHRGKISYAFDKQIKEADIIFLCLKSFQIGAAIKKIAHFIKAKTSIILAHNGMGTLSALPETLINQHNIYALLTTHGCLRNAPLTITHTGIGKTDLGLVSGNANPLEQKLLTQRLNDALPNVTLHQHIEEKQWLKLAINSVINPLTAIHDIDNGHINSDTFNEKTIKILTEVVKVAAHEGTILDRDSLTKTVFEVAAATAKNCSSMRCDVLANKQTEIDYINGYIHRLGVKHKVATPENTQLWQQVSSLTL